jgi:hypothetical protein
MDLRRPIPVSAHRAQGAVMQVETVKVKPWGEEQGDYVVINKEHFDPEVHQLVDEPKAKKVPKAEPEKKD